MARAANDVSSDQDFEDEVDVIVVGSGAGGMSAALTAADADLNVLILEKTDHIGGGTAISGGAVWIPGNPHIGDVGQSDSAEQVKTYLRAILGNRMRHDMIDAFLIEGPRMVSFLEEKTAVRFAPRSYSPDYQPDLPGASLGGRTIDPTPFDGRALGEHFALLRPPLPEFLVFGGMMVNRKDIDTLLGATTSWANFRDGAKLILGFLRDRLKLPRGARLLMGNALAGQLLKSALDKNIALKTAAPATALICEGARVVGVAAMIEGRERRLRARRGVVLATGGFPGDVRLQAEHVPHAERHYSMAPASNTGDGMRLALAVGASLEESNIGAAFWAPVSVMRAANGREIRFPHLILDRQKPGLIAVNQLGRRFVNEATSYHEFVEAMHRSHDSAPTIPAYLICDARFLRAYGLGLVRPGLRPLGAFLKAGYLTAAPTVRELARKLDIDAAALDETVTTMNRYAQTGIDLDFGKGGDEYNRYLGDPAHKPNPCLGPIEKPPFYAVRVWPGDIGTATGVKVDAKARPLDREGRPIAGLFVCGNDMNSIMAGAYPGAGITLGPALTFGYIAGKELARDAS